MADFLTAVSTKKITKAESLVQEVENFKLQNVIDVSSAASALEALKNGPDRTTVYNVLKYLTGNGFSLNAPEPINASIAYQLINDTIPNYWTTLRNSSDAKLLAQILRNPVGLGHVITRLRSLIVDSRQRKAPDQVRNTSEHIEDLLDVVMKVLDGNHTSYLVLKSIQNSGKDSVQKKLLWAEYLVLITSGRLVAITAEAEDAIKDNSRSKSPCWVSDGKRFATWLGANLADLARETNGDEDQSTATAELFSRALSLGYTGKLQYMTLDVLLILKTALPILFFLTLQAKMMLSFWQVL